MMPSTEESFTNRKTIRVPEHKEEDELSREINIIKKRYSPEWINVSSSMPILSPVYGGIEYVITITWGELV